MPETPARNGTAAAARMSATARAAQRRFLSRAGLRVGDLDALSYELLRGWAEASAAGEHGAARLCMQDLARRLEGQVRAPGDDDEAVDTSIYTPDELTELKRLLRKGGVTL